MQKIYDIRANERERYRWLKSHGMCVRCAHEKAVPGKVCCPECGERARERQRLYHDDERKQYEKNRYYLRKAEGVCVVCGRPADNCVFCDYHREYRRKYYYSIKEKKA